MKPKTVAVIGASSNRSKYGNLAVRAHREAGYEVFPVHPTATEVEGLPAFARIEDVPGGPLDRVTCYLPPSILLPLLDAIAERGAGEVWLNPGTDTPEVVARARSLGLHVIEGCSIVDARIGAQSS